MQRRLLYLIFCVDFAQCLTVFTNEFSGPYTFDDDNQKETLTSTEVTLGTFCSNSQCIIQFDFQIHSTALDLSMAGLLCKTEDDDGTSTRSAFSGFKISLGMMSNLRAEVSIAQTQTPSHDYVEHPLPLSINTWYKASINISTTWIQIYVDDIPGPVRYGDFDNIANSGSFILGQDTCCGDEQYRFIGSIKDIILYSDVESTPEIKITVDNEHTYIIDHIIGAGVLGAFCVILVVGIFAYVRFDKEWQQQELKRVRQMHEAFIPPEKIKNSAAWQYEQNKVIEKKRRNDFKNAPQFYD